MGKPYIHILIFVMKDKWLDELRPHSLGMFTFLPHAKEAISISQFVYLSNFLVLARFGEWFPVELRSTCKLDLEFSKKFTDHFVKIYNLEQCNTNNFTVFPKKVTRDQPKIIIILKKPLDSGDDVRVEFSCGRRTEGSTFIKIENPYTLSVRLPGSCFWLMFKIYVKKSCGVLWFSFLPQICMQATLEFRIFASS